MTLRFTPDTLRAAYEFLRTTPPFNRWKLPAPEYVEFGFIREQGTAGDYLRMPSGNHRIRLSDKRIGHTDLLVATLAHEMVHMRQSLLGRTRQPFSHGADFKRLAAQVCRHHGFDPKAF